MADTITKGLIGENDIKHYDGVSDTFNRPTSTGGSTTLRRIGSEVDVLMAYGNGSSFTRTSINSAINTIGAANRCIVLRPGTWVIDDDLTIPANIILHVIPGALLTVASGKTLTLGNAPTAGLYQIFTGSGSVVFSSSATVYPEWWGAVGDNSTDDHDAIQGAIDCIEASGGGAVEFQNKVYAVGSTLTINTNHVMLRGVGTNRGATSYTPLLASGAHIQYISDDGGILLDFEKSDGSILYGFDADNIRFGGAPGLSSKPVLVKLYQVSEFFFRSTQFHDGSIGLQLCGVGDGHLEDYMFSTNTYHVNIAPTDGTLPNAFYIVFGKGSLWDASGASIYVDGSSTTSVRFDHAFFERSDSFIRLRNGATDNYATHVSWTFHACNFIQDSTRGLDSRDGWVLDAMPTQATNDRLRLIDWHFDKCRFTYADSTGAHFYYYKGTNTTASSYMERLRVTNSSTTSAAGVLFNSDTSDSSVYVEDCTKPSAASWTAGSIRINKREIAFAYWSYKDSYGLQLPQGGPHSNSIDGILSYDATRDIATVTGDSKIYYINKARVSSDNGDNDVTLTEASEPTQRWATTLTADRTVNLPSTSQTMHPGMRFRIVRTAAGAYNLNVGTGPLKALAKGEWCDIEATDHNTWVLTAHGSL